MRSNGNGRKRTHRAGQEPSQSEHSRFALRGVSSLYSEGRLGGPSFCETLFHSALVNATHCQSLARIRRLEECRTIDRQGSARVLCFGCSTGAFETPDRGEKPWPFSATKIFGQSWARLPGPDRCCRRGKRPLRRCTTSAEGSPKLGGEEVCRLVCRPCRRRTPWCRAGHARTDLRDSGHCCGCHRRFWCRVAAIHSQAARFASEGLS
jgi:hypothetical protein